jgi:hypothetical protein
MNFDDIDGRDTTASRQWVNQGVRAYSRRSGERQPKG